jgi:hypothetical protein
MNAPQHPNFPPTGQMPQQQPPAAMARLFGIVRSLSGTAGAIALVVIAAQQVLPESAKPSTLIGGLYGKMVAAESGAAQDTLAQQQRKATEAQALPPVIAQRIDRSLETQTTIANTADVACAAGALMPLDNSDWGKVGQSLRQACGVGDQVRKNMAGTLRRNTIQEGQNGQ